MDPSERTAQSPKISHALRGRLGAHVAHSRNDPQDMTKAARLAFMSTFERQADPDCILTDDERIRRATHLRKAHFTRMAMKSAETRANRVNRRRAKSVTIDPCAPPPAGPVEAPAPDRAMSGAPVPGMTTQ